VGVQRGKRLRRHVEVSAASGESCRPAGCGLLEWRVAWAANLDRQAAIRIRDAANGFAMASGSLDAEARAAVRSLIDGTDLDEAVQEETLAMLEAVQSKRLRDLSGAG
jgi:hypothetical protein